MELVKGTLVTSNVRLARPLGEGGMGAVWAAEHLGLDTEVAVKFIHAEALERDPSLADRFKLEASIAAKLRSPHVVQVLDHGRMEDGTPFIVMELLEGEDLEARLDRGALSASEIVLLVSQVAEVLERAHGAGVVHRDLKPENMFVIDSGYEIFVKVLDFGVAKHTQLPEQSMTTTGAMVGTPVYMSPELIESAKHADHHADLWALAVVAYEALVGRMPFSGETLGALCIAISKAEFAAPSSLRDHLTADVDAFFDKALARERQDRFATARDLALAFATALDAAPGSSLPIARSSESTTRQSRPKKSETPTVDVRGETADTQLSATAMAESVPATTRRDRPSGPTFSPASSSKPAEDEKKRRPWAMIALAITVALGFSAWRIMRAAPSAHNDPAAQTTSTPPVTPSAAPSAAPSEGESPDEDPSAAPVASVPPEFPEPSATPSASVALAYPQRVAPPSALPSTAPSASATASKPPSCMFINEHGHQAFRRDLPECRKLKTAP